MDEDLQTQTEAYERIKARFRGAADRFWPVVEFALIYGAVMLACNLVGAYYRWAGV